MGPVVLAVAMRDEIDVVRTWLDYHLARGIDHIIATDHRSVDGTSDVLREYERAGVIDVIREDGLAFEQSRWASAMAHLAQRRGASWVLHADVDEFVWPDGRDLRTVLAAVPARIGKVFLARQNFLPTRSEVAPFWARCIVRERVARNGVGQPLPPKVAHRVPGPVAVHMGGHDADGVGEGVALDTPDILHFPVRSWAQFERKVRQSVAALEANPGLPSDVCITWRTRGAEQREGRLRSYWETLVRRGEDAAPDDVSTDDRLARWMTSHAPATCATR